MSFDLQRWPDAVTIAWLIERGLDAGLHCYPCGRHVVVKPAALPFAADTPMPAMEGRFRCTRCGSTKTAARPEWPDEGGRKKGAYIAGQ